MVSRIERRMAKAAPRAWPRHACRAVAAVVIGTGFSVAAVADEAQQLGEMVVSTEQPAVPANLPATTEGVDAKKIAESVNAVTAAETIQYLPSVHVRERYIGDRNAIIAMRTNSSIASAQTILYADGLLLSNFLNNSFSTPPRWGMVSPDEIERVDVIYGPFSALYPGNSMGGVVLMSTRMPTRFEAHAGLDLFTQRFRLYGTDDRFNGGHANFALGNKAGDWSFWLSGDHLDSHAQPQTFQNTIASNTAGAAVSGGFRDTDTTGAPRTITGAGGIDHTVQDNGKLKLAYDFSKDWRATYTLGVWQNRSDVSIASYLRDAAGRPVYNAAANLAAPKSINVGGQNVTLSSNAPNQTESEHWMHALALKSNTGGTWDWEAIGSVYRQNYDVLRTAVPTSGFDSGNDATRPGGTLTRGDGTGWMNLDLRGDFRPEGSRKSAHQWSFGAHYDRYVLSSDTYAVASDWRDGPTGALSSNSKGKTETQALYVQDAWRFAPDWQLVAGGRYEQWRAFDGSNFTASNAPPTPKNVVYAEREVSAFSPKLSLSWAASADWNLRGAFGKAYRFPTVQEMFQSISLPGNQKTNDPNLKPEQVRSAEFAVERALARGLWRTSLFREDKRNGLISQTDTTTIPGTSITSVQNVDRIRTLGVEAALQLTDFWIRGLDLSGSVTYADSEIRRYDRFPNTVGRPQPRIPDWRATLVGVYHASDRLSYSAALRYSGRQHVNLQYLDVNPDVYGTAVSSYTVLDVKALYRIDKQWTASLGVNNLGNYKYYVNPNPYPQRTLFASVKFDY